MNSLQNGLLAMAFSAPAWAAAEPSNVTTTTWEIYGFVLVAFVVGVAWVLWYKKREEKQEKREKRRESRASNAA
jgi:hypothetical protein